MSLTGEITVADGGGPIAAESSYLELTQYWRDDPYAQAFRRWYVADSVCGPDQDCPVPHPDLLSLEPDPRYRERRGPRPVDKPVEF